MAATREVTAEAMEEKAAAVIFSATRLERLLVFGTSSLSVRLTYRRTTGATAQVAWQMVSARVFSIVRTFML